MANWNIKVGSSGGDSKVDMTVIGEYRQSDNDGKNKMRYNFA